jgi:hypothetical protein
MLGLSSKQAGMLLDGE